MSNPAIPLISGLLSKTVFPDHEEQLQIGKLLQKYPYFLPLRFAKANADWATTANRQDVLAAAYSYTGNRLQFFSFLNNNGADVTENVYPAANLAETEAEQLLSTIEIALDDEVEELPIGNQPENNENAIDIANEIPVPESKTDDVLELSQPIETLQKTEQSVIIEESADDEHEIEMSQLQEAETFQEDEMAILEEMIEDEATEELIAAETETTDLPEDMNAGSNDTEVAATLEELSFSPLSAEDYFSQQGFQVSADIPEQNDETDSRDLTDKSLMIMMSFTEWLLHFRNKKKKEKEEAEEQKAVKSMWQKEKLAAAMEEEDDEIPENVFEMAVNSIAKEEGLASESLANIYVKQRKYDQAIEMYKKLSLRNPQKSAYFASKIDSIIKQRES